MLLSQVLPSAQDAFNVLRERAREVPASEDFQGNCHFLLLSDNFVNSRCDRNNREGELGEGREGLAQKGLRRLGLWLCSGIWDPAEHEEHLEDVGRTSEQGMGTDSGRK